MSYGIFSDIFASDLQPRVAKGKRNATSGEEMKFLPVPLSVWDLYYHQYEWMQRWLSYRPLGSWWAFHIPPDEEVETDDWQLRIEQRIWLQEHFNYRVGPRHWLPFRQTMIPAD